MTRLVALSLVAVAGAATASAGFQHTSPVLGWSTDPAADLSSLLRPAHAPSSSQLALSSSPLCPSSRLSSLLLISAPSLSFSSLPSDVKTAYSIAPRQSRIKLVYAGEHEREKVWERAAAGWREGECTGEVTVEEAVDHDDIGSIIASHLGSSSAPHLVLLTSSPSPSRLSKRQLVDPASPLAAAMGLVPLQEGNGTTNGTMPDPNSGLLERYRFFSNYLIVGIAVFVLILLPAVLLGSDALTNIGAPHGLNHKMVGSISEGKSG